jgi:GNAT superfamily N-acetyltransferase
LLRLAAMFSGTDFSRLTPEIWNPDLPSALGEGFRCVRGEFATYWKRGRVARECRASVAQAYVLAVEGRLAAYMTLLADKLAADERLLRAEDIKYRTFPAIKIGLLAADRRAKGAGTRMVVWALESAAFDFGRHVGVRFVTVDALFDKDTGFDAAPFYERLGFNHVNLRAESAGSDGFRTMYFDLRLLSVGPDS